MGFWGKLGKIGLKIAPYAAMAIPGVGPLASMAIAGGIGAAQKKASGGSWKDALISGGTSAALSKIPGLDKIGPSSGALSKIVGGAAGKQGLGWQGKLGGIAKDAIMNRGQRPNPNSGSAESIFGVPGQGVSSPWVMNAQSSGGGQDSGLSPFHQRMRDQFGPIMGQQDQSNPNLADSIGAGRMAARRRPAYY